MDIYEYIRRFSNTQPIPPMARQELTPDEIRRQNAIEDTGYPPPDMMDEATRNAIEDAGKSTPPNVLIQGIPKQMKGWLTPTSNTLPDAEFSRQAKQFQQFPGPDFKPYNADEISPLPKLTQTPQRPQNRPQSEMGDTGYRDTLQKILKADRMGRGLQAGEQGMSNAMKLLLTTGSAIRTGAPPVPNLQSGSGLGAAMTGNAGMQMKALEGQENRELRRDQMATNQDYRNFLEEQRLRSQDRADMMAGRLPPKGQEQLIFADNALSAINRIRSKLPEIESGIGPIQGRIQNILVNVGIAEPNMAVTNANLVELMARQVQSISGVAVSNQEFNRLRQAGPNIAQDPEQFKALLDNFEEIVKTRKNGVLKMYGKMGYNVAPLMDEGESAGNTRAYSVNGVIYDIPVNEVQAFLRDHPNATEER